MSAAAHTMTRRRGAVALVLRQVRFTNRAFWRNPASAFFTFAFPLMFLVIFTALLGNGTVSLGGKLVKQTTYYVAAMSAFAVITACYTNMAISVTFQRDGGILKRARGTPMPGWGYLAARVIHSSFRFCSPCNCHARNSENIKRVLKKRTADRSSHPPIESVLIA